MRKGKEGIIYCAVWAQTGEPFYVGQTRQKLSARVNGHFRDGKTPMSRVVRELGRADVVFREIEKVAGPQLDDRERFWIEKLNTRHPFGLNHSAGGQSGGLHLPVSKAKMSKIMKAKCADPDYYAGMVARNGKLWSDPEYRKRQAAGRVEVLGDPVYLARLAAIKNEYWSDPEKHALASAKAKEQWADPEQKALKSARIRETLSTPEHKERASKLRKEMWADPERRAKQLASMRAGTARWKAERLLRA